MKKTIITSAFALTLLLGGSSISYAQMGMMGGSWQSGYNATELVQSQELKDALAGILSNQNITTQGEVDCSEVTNNQFDELGDAYMGTMLPNKQQHEAMDAMMGGEDSESLRQAHINMGRSYLGCWSDYNSGPVFMPMMGGVGMMGTDSSEPDTTNRYNHNSMMDYGHGGLGGGLFMILFWLLIFAGVIALVRYTMKSNKTSVSSKSALDILKERYAKGEIEKEEFETKKKDL